MESHLPPTLSRGWHVGRDADAARGVPHRSTTRSTAARPSSGSRACPPTASACSKRSCSSGASTGATPTLHRPRVAGELPRGGAPRDRPQPGDAGVSVAEHDLLLRATLGPDDDGPRRLRALARARPISRRIDRAVAARARAARRASRRPAGRRGRRQGAANRALHVAAHAGAARARHARGPPSHGIRRSGRC